MLMKRGSALVSYSSSDEEAPSPAVPPGTQRKKRKLPALAETIATPPLVDNPALHQGRIRTTPHVDGQWAAHVYVSVKLGESSPLYKLVQIVLDDSKKMVPNLKELSKLDDGRCELHISLSRPIFLRAHQKEQLRAAVKKAAGEHSAFNISFASFSELINDEKTRTFLAMEVGAGHHDLRKLSDSLSPTLESIRQKGYYSNPRFHASIAWALLSRPGHSVDGEPQSANQVEGEQQYQALERLPQDLLSILGEKYCITLASAKTGTFEVIEVCIKIGKEVSKFRLKS